MAAGPVLNSGQTLTMQLNECRGDLPPHVASPSPNLYQRDSYVVVDFETTNFFKGSPNVAGNRIVLACWKRGRGGDGSYIDVKWVRGSEFDMAELVSDIKEASFVVAHNAKFEIGWLARCGVDLRKIVCFDTLIGEYVLGGNRYALQQLGLDACLARYGMGSKNSTVSAMIKEEIPTEEIPESWLLKYCKLDVLLCEQMFLKQRKLLQNQKLDAIMYQRCLLTPVLADIEKNGMQLDVAIVKSTLLEVENEYYKKEAELQEFMGGVPPGSTARKCEYIYGELGFETPLDHRGNPMLTPKGAPSAAADVLQKLRPTNDRQREFLRLHEEWANLNSDVTKYLRKFNECCEQAGGLLHSTFNQCSTRTHRLSNSGLEFGVQFQNFNRRFKPVFRARNDGWVVAEADGAQLEFRAAVHLGRDRVGLYDIVTGVDVHAFTASIIGCSRQEAKSHTFKPLYGGKSGTDSERAYYAAFAAKYKTITDTQNGWAHEVLRTKRLRTEWGMVFYWPDTVQKRSGYITNTNNIYNYPVQSFATAEIIPCALICAWHRMKDWKGFLVNTVHDSLIAELPLNEVPMWHALSKQCLIADAYQLIRQLYGVSITVPLGVGVMVGRNWASKEAKESEVVYTAEDHYWKPAAIAEGMTDE